LFLLGGAVGHAHSFAGVRDAHSSVSGAELASTLSP
jgi:hypothetical protein